ncbi:hypothetical protein CKO45_32235, partial [Paracraurococcus ruber]|nr:hypothetical protein [Paracraurococcus ruber]
STTGGSNSQGGSQASTGGSSGQGGGQASTGGGSGQGGGQASTGGSSGQGGSQASTGGSSSNSPGGSSSNSPGGSQASTGGSNSQGNGQANTGGSNGQGNGQGTSTPPGSFQLGAFTVFGLIPQNECGAGGFANCVATPGGTASGSGGEPTIFKLNADGSTDLGRYVTVDGSEFPVRFDASTDRLSFQFVPNPGDPLPYYVAIKQADGYYLLSRPDPADAGRLLPIQSFDIALGQLFRQPGYSHITFFGSGAWAPPGPG